MRNALLLSLISLLTAINMLAAPLPKESELNKTYYPTTIGTKWTYQFINSEEEKNFIIVDSKDKHKFQQISIDEIKKPNVKVPYETLLVSPDEIIEIQDVNDIPKSLITVLKSTKDKMRKWNGSFFLNDIGKNTIDATFISYPPELCAVPYGNFQAIRVDAKWKYDNEQNSRTCWYAPQIGLIKQLCVTGDTLVLKSFSSGKGHGHD